jgi:hypothetical protein
MSTTIPEETVTRRMAALAAEAHRIQLSLGGRRDVPAEAWGFAEGFTEAVERASREWLDGIDPQLREELLHTALSLARTDRGDTDTRRRLMVGLQRAGDVLDRIAEAEPVSEARSPNEVAAWLVSTIEAPQASIAELLGTSTRTLTRWVSGDSEPDGDDARRLRVVAGVVSRLRHALTNGGVLAWFDWENDLLDGRTPREALDDPTQTATLFQLATRLRSSIAS